MKKVVIILAASVLGVACSAKANVSSPNTTAAVQTTQAALPSTITIQEGDMFLHPSATTVAAGKVTFTVTNGGTIQHEFVIVTGDPSGTTGDEAGKVSEADHIGGDNGPEIGNVPPGGTRSLTANLAPGTYTAMCNLPGHFSAGMHFSFTVA